MSFHFRSEIAQTNKASKQPSAALRIVRSTQAWLETRCQKECGNFGIKSKLGVLHLLLPTGPVSFDQWSFFSRKLELRVVQGEYMPMYAMCNSQSPHFYLTTNAISIPTNILITWQKLRIWSNVKAFSRLKTAQSLLHGHRLSFCYLSNERHNFHTLMLTPLAEAWFSSRFWGFPATNPPNSQERTP